MKRIISSVILGLSLIFSAGCLNVTFEHKGRCPCRDVCFDKVCPCQDKCPCCPACPGHKECCDKCPVEKK